MADCGKIFHRKWRKVHIIGIVHTWSQTFSVTKLAKVHWVRLWSCFCPFLQFATPFLQFATAFFNWISLRFTFHICSSPFLRFATSLPPICHCIFQLEFSEIHICSAPSNCMHLLSNCMHLPSLPSHRIGNTIWHELLVIFGDTCQLRVSSLQSLVFWRGSPFISWLCAQKIANAWDSLTCNVA